MPSTYEDLEKYKFIKIKSKRNGVLKILKGEEVDVEILSTEESYYYKVYYYGFFQGFYCCYNTVTEKDKVIKYLEWKTKLQQTQNNILHDLCKEASIQNAELIKIINNKNKVNLWNKIKAVFKK